MLVYRIAREVHLSDLSGTGARLYGGRWNQPGTAMLYTAEYRSLAALEILVHLSKATWLPDYGLAEISIPDSLKIKMFDLKSLPKDWTSHPAPAGLGKLGTEWLMKGETPLLKVPSAVMVEEHNYLINPLHPQARKIKVKRIRAFSFDSRLV